MGTAPALSEKTILLSGKPISERIAAMAEEVRERLQNERYLLVGIRDGGVILGKRIQKYLEGKNYPPLGTGTLDITLYRDDFSHRKVLPQVRKSDLLAPIDDRAVVLVDDVIYTGRTVRAALDALISYGRPSLVFLVVLVDRGGRELPIEPQVAGFRFSIPKDQVCFVEFTEQGSETDRIYTCKWTNLSP